MPESPRRLELRLSIPASQQYRALAAEVAAKFAEYAGSDAGTAAELRKAVDRLAGRVTGGQTDGNVDFDMEARGAVLTITASSGAKTDRTTCPLPD